MITKRALDILLSGIALLLLGPFFLICAIAIKQDSKGPVFFRQKRVGRHGRIFRIYKFRTMFWRQHEPGLSLTVGNDMRVTRVGSGLRKYKLDELPQLINVVLGEMSLVGPRPEVPEYVAYYPTKDREIVLSIRPGITDDGSLAFIDEAAIIANVSDPQQFYISTIIPKKLSFYKNYVAQQSLALDIAIIFRTLLRVFVRKAK